MASVELAVRHEGTFQRLYAIKRPHPSFWEEPEFRKMFLDEARIAGLIRHPNVVSALDLGEDDRGPYLVMDWVDGVSAAALIRRTSEVGEALPIAVCLDVVRQAALGLSAAHDLVGPDGAPLHVVHRDVSPQNILVGFDGIVRVTDFGVAKALGRLSSTVTAALKGKFGYMSPEQLRFEEPDHRSDLFALGIVLFELCTGTRLYKGGEGMEGVRRILNEPPPDLGEHREDAPPALVQLLFSLLAKEPSARPPDAAEVARRLGRIAESEGEAGGTSGPLVERLFGGDRQELRARVTASLAVLPQEPTLVTVSKAEARAPRTSVPITWALAALAVLLLAALVLWPRGAPPRPERSAPRAAPTSEVAAPPPPAFQETPTTAPVAPAEPAAATSPDRSSRRPAKARTAPAETGGTTKVPSWGWQ
jgi:serine/threonine-protein kinase